MTDTEPRPDAAADRQLDAAALKALAHPLRVQIFDSLSTFGSATASMLAERLGESSGATSYHLRQLERHGLVREVEGKGTSRERWWERPPGAVSLGIYESDAPAGHAAATMIYRELRRNEERILNDYIELGPNIFTGEWDDVGAISTMNGKLTAEQLKIYIDEIMLVNEKFFRKYRGQEDPRARSVHVVFQAFPVVDPLAAPDTNSSASGHDAVND